MSEKLWWYMARAGGLTAWWLLAGAVLWGLLLSTRVAAGKVTPPWLLDLHRFLGGLAFSFTALHVAGLVADKWADFGLAEVLVPLASSWRPVPVALGVVGLYLIAAVEVTSLMRRRLPRRIWRAVHSTSFVLFLTATGHALTAGSEAANPAVRISAVAMLACFMFLIAYRAAVRLAPSPVRAQ